MRIIWQALDSVYPENAINKHVSLKWEDLYIDDHKINLDAFENIYIIGAGKASAQMAKALENILTKRIKGGMICIKPGHGTRLHNILVVEASHPVPDENSYLAAKKTLEMANEYGPKDLVLCLLSGGASSIWALPYHPVSLEHKQKCTEILLGCGADIHEINAVRKHISRIKGGRLAQAIHPARLITLAISDVVGDKLTSIGSGPTVGDPTTYYDAMEVIEKYSLSPQMPESVLNHLWAGINKEVKDTPLPNDGIFKGNVELIVSSNKQALDTALQTATYLGYDAGILSTEITGEAREVGKRIIERARNIIRNRIPGSPPSMLLLGGETTVTLRGRGKGGRNQELVLAAAIEMQDLKNMVVASVGTDGTDGPTDAAGAFADSATVARGNDIGLDAEKYLRNNNSYEYFRRLGDLIKTGPTGTNVMDIQALLIF
jgi:glycerate 2-kinase